MRFLVIEDEPDLAIQIAELLKSWPSVVDVVQTLRDAREVIASFDYDLMVVDRTLPDGDALSLLPEMRSSVSRPAVVMLTARDATGDIVDALDVGADDYLTKPFEPEELLARIRAVLRRPKTPASSEVSLGNLRLEIGTHNVTIQNRIVILRHHESLLLEALLLRRNRVVTREFLMSAIYGVDDSVESNTLEAQLSRLRKRLSDFGADVEIRSVRGVGYLIRSVSA
jgi:DNA-binding response OmpR family regulator